MSRVLDSLNAEFAQRSPALWSVTIEQSAPSVDSDLLSQDSLLGEFLRAARQYELDSNLPIELHTYLGQHVQNASLNPLTELNDLERRRRVLSEVAALGQQLLGCEEPLA